MSETTPTRPVPKPNVYVDTAPFWDAAARKELVLQQCQDTGRFQHYPRPVSIYTGSRNLAWKPVSGKGTIYTHTTVRIPGPGLDGRIPLPVATVELDEGVRMIANIVESDPEAIKVGARVEVAWDPLDDGKFYPAFKLV